MNMIFRTYNGYF